MSTELDPNAVADNVRRYRLALNWTQGELAKEMTTAGCPTSLKQISNTELGQRRVDVEQLLAFAQVFEIPVEKLFEVQVVDLHLSDKVAEMLSILEEQRVLDERLQLAKLLVHEAIQRIVCSEPVTFSQVLDRITWRPGLSLQLLLSVSDEFSR